MERETICIIREIYTQSHVSTYTADVFPKKHGINDETHFCERLYSQMLNNYGYLVKLVVKLTFQHQLVSPHLPSFTMLPVDDHVTTLQLKQKQRK
jgi:hypothetical protein